jgi:hypothetical protein
MTSDRAWLSSFLDLTGRLPETVIYGEGSTPISPALLREGRARLEKLLRERVPAKLLAEMPRAKNDPRHPQRALAGPGVLTDDQTLRVMAHVRAMLTTVLLDRYGPPSAGTYARRFPIEGELVFAPEPRGGVRRYFLGDAASQSLYLIAEIIERGQLRVCAREECHHVFIPTKRQQWCSASCGNIIRMRRYRLNPQNREKAASRQKHYRVHGRRARSLSAPFGAHPER